MAAYWEHELKDYCGDVVGEEKGGTNGVEIR